MALYLIFSNRQECEPTDQRAARVILVSTRSQDAAPPRSAPESTPAFVRFIFSADSEWPGWQWFIGDMVIFWGSVGVMALLVKFARKLDA